MNILESLTNRLKRADESFNEWRLGIDSSEIHLPYDPSRPEVRGYGPTFFRDWRIIKPHILVDPESTFIDYGAGLGRVAILAARLPFAMVIGIEFDPALMLRGRANSKSAKSRAQIILEDAATFNLPPNTSTLYICNSFTGSVLAGALDKVRDSYDRKRRPMKIICNLPHESAFEPEIRRVNWINLTHELALFNGRKCLIFAPT
jgi:SAM-dependent methyltransferase